MNVNSKHLGDEVNFAADWAVNKHLVFTGMYGFNVPGEAGRHSPVSTGLVHFHAVYGREALKDCVTAISTDRTQEVDYG